MGGPTPNNQTQRAKRGQQPISEGVVTVWEYRRILNDKTSSDEEILSRINYLEALCRNVVRAELTNLCRKQEK